MTPVRFLLAAASTATLTTTGAAQFLDAYQLDGTGQTQPVHSLRSVGQSWTVGTYGVLEQLELSLAALGSSAGPGDLTLEVLDLSGGDPAVAPVLGALALSEGDLGPEPWLLETLVLKATVIDLAPLVIPVSPGDVLAFRLTSTRDLPSYYTVRSSVTDAYGDGALFSDDVFVPGVDIAFKAFLDTCVAPASTTVRNGSGLNPTSFTQVSPPFLGTTWDTAVDLVTPGATGSLLALSVAGPTQGTFLTGSVLGELLILPPYLPPDFSPFGTHAVAVPQNCTLLGAQVHAQAAHLVGANWTLTNALDLTLGTF